jgi:hypothetical protein
MEQIYFRSQELNVSGKDIHLGLGEFLTPDFSLKKLPSVTATSAGNV